MNAAAEIRHEARASRELRGGRYVLETEFGEAALTYRLDGRRMIIDHTYTPPAARGRKIALSLVERAVADARDQNLKVVPECPYVARVFAQRWDWADLLA